MNIGSSALAWDHSSAPDIQSIVPLGEGDTCLCYLVNQTHVLRLAKHAEASAALQREIQLLSQLQNHLNVCIPQIQDTGTQVETGERFVFYPLVSGALLKAEKLSALKTACRATLIRQVAEFASQLHRFPVATARACGVKELNPHEYLPNLMQRARAALANRLDAAVWQYYEQLLALYLSTPALYFYTPALLHGDLSPDHLLADFNDCALTGIIDFGDCFIGDPLREFIFVLEDYGPEILNLLLTFYAPETTQAARRRIRLFQQMNNVEYCLTQLSEGNQEALEAAICVLIAQATIEPMR